MHYLERFRSETIVYFPHRDTTVLRNEFNEPIKRTLRVRRMRCSWYGPEDFNVGDTNHRQWIAPD